MTKSVQQLVISPIEEIINEARNGKMFILVDHEDRENEGDLIIPAEMATAETVNFMAKYGRGLICLALTGDRVDHLNLPLMSSHNSSRHETAFTISIEAREGVTTGISAHDRAHTISVAIGKNRSSSDIATPGHVFPLRAKEGGVLVRAGHTEAAVDISRLAGLNESGVICEIMNDDGTMSRLDDLIGFAKQHGLRIGTISDLISYRRRHDNLVAETSNKMVSSVYGGDWQMRTFKDEIQGGTHVVLSKGTLDKEITVLTRMHVFNPFEDALGINDGNSPTLSTAMRIISQEGRGVVVLLRDMNTTLSADSEPSSSTLREYGLGAQILAELGLGAIELLTNSPSPKVVGLDAYGLKITGTRPLTHEELDDNIGG